MGVVDNLSNAVNMLADEHARAPTLEQVWDATVRNPDWHRENVRVGVNLATAWARYRFAPQTDRRAIHYDSRRTLLSDDEDARMDP